MTLRSRNRLYLRHSLPIACWIALAPLTVEGALPTKDFTSAPCASAAAAALEKWGATDEWQPQTDPGPNAKSFRSPTKRFGVWVEAQLHAGEAPILLRLTENSTIRIGYDAKDCAPTIATGKQGWREAQGQWLGDPEIAALLKKNPQGVLYLWSPRFTHSVTAFEELKKAAKSAGVPVFTAMDPSAPQGLLKEISKRSREAGLSEARFSSIELHARGVMGHFPMALVFRDGKILAPPIVGANASEFYAAEISARLQRKE
jgi:hypothetical protein